MNDAQRESLIAFYVVWEAVRSKEYGTEEHLGGKIIRESIVGYLKELCNYNVKDFDHGNESVAEHK